MSELEVFNGINFVTSDHLVPPVATPDLAARILRAKRSLKEEKALRWSHERDFRNRGPDRRPSSDVDPMDLASSGWGVIWPEGMSMDVIKALRPLLDHRKEQAARKVKTYYRELEYIPGESKSEFFKRHKVGAGPAHPKKLPYYLLIVGAPDIVPYRFQYLLDMQYAVGRIFFEDPDSYRYYAESVILAEGGQSHVRPEACFFSVRTPRDRATLFTDEYLVKPLAESLETGAEKWKIRLYQGEQASKGKLSQLLGRGETPALLLTAAHGLGFPSGHKLQKNQQGAVICADWPGRKRAILPEHYFSADDIGTDARIHGLIAFLFGCYSAGTPAEDNFPPASAWGQPAPRPPSKPFMSGLARRLLSHPKGGALAVVGHVDRAWATSFGSDRDEGIFHFSSFFQQLLQGYPVGLAMDWLNERFAELSTQLSDIYNEYEENPVPVSKRTREDVRFLVELWRANNDARNFVILGDPAVRLAKGPLTAYKPEIAELRAEPGRLYTPVRTLWNRHVENWLSEVSSRESLDLGDPSEAIRGPRTAGEGQPLSEQQAQGEGEPEGKRVVVDASTVLALLLQMPQAEQIAKRFLEAQGNIHAPHLLDIEIAQVLGHHAAANSEQAERCRQALEDLRRMPVFRHDIFFDRVWELRQDFTTSEATYLALAEFLTAPLLTCGDHFLRSGHQAKVEVVSPQP